MYSFGRTKRMKTYQVWTSRMILQQNTDWIHILLIPKTAITGEPFADFGSARMIYKSSGADTHTCLKQMDNVQRVV